MSKGLIWLNRNRFRRHACRLTSISCLLNRLLRQKMWSFPHGTPDSWKVIEKSLGNWTWPWVAPDLTWKPPQPRKQTRRAKTRSTTSQPNHIPTTTIRTFRFQVRQYRGWVWYKEKLRGFLKGECEKAITLPIIYTIYGIWIHGWKGDYLSMEFKFTGFKVWFLIPFLKFFWSESR